jgi:hypothetical protein
LCWPLGTARQLLVTPRPCRAAWFCSFLVGSSFSCQGPDVSLQLHRNLSSPSAITGLIIHLKPFCFPTLAAFVLASLMLLQSPVTLTKHPMVRPERRVCREEEVGEGADLCHSALLEPHCMQSPDRSAAGHTHPHSYREHPVASPMNTHPVNCLKWCCWCPAGQK